MDPRDPGQIRSLARTEPTGVEKLHRHRHPRLAFELALGNMQRAQKRFGVGNPERFHARNLRHQPGVGKARQPIRSLLLSIPAKPLDIEEATSSLSPQIPQPPQPPRQLLQTLRPRVTPTDPGPSAGTEQSGWEICKRQAERLLRRTS